MIKPARKTVFGLFLIATVALLLPGCASNPNSGDFGRVLLGLLVALAAARIGGELFARLGQPAVLGELLLGVIVGNLSLAGVHAFDFIRQDATHPQSALNLLAQLGIIVLLFQIGLESDFRKMRQVLSSSLLAASLGLLASFALGTVVAAVLLPGSSVHEQVFLGVLIASSSIGIAGRVFLDLGRLQTPEARIVLGAAVIDDMIGLIVLTVVTAIITAAGKSQPWSAGSIVGVVTIAAAFPVVAVLLGRQIVPRVLRYAVRLRGTNVLLAASLGLCFAFAYIAQAVGLAPIIGAFAAGLVLEDAHWRSFFEHGEQSVLELIRPIVGFLTPIFFFITGARVDLAVFAQSHVWALAIALTVAAIIGKQFCGLGVLQSGVRRMAVGIGMIPRGEVVLIAAAIGRTLMIGRKPVVSPDIYTAAVFVVVVTTLITPPLLNWSLRRRHTTGAP